jgi:hypothetical protein
VVKGSGDTLAEWSLEKVWFNFKSYNSMKELLAAWRAPNSAVKAGFKWREPSKRGELCRYCVA